MTTPLIPTKTTLAATRYTPAELVEDSEFESYLLGLAEGYGIQFIRAMMSAYRAGNSSFDFTFKTNSSALAVAEKLSKPVNENGYGYTVTGPGPTPNATITVTLI